MPAAARDFFAGPLQIRIVGANGESRGFLAVSDADRQAALALVKELTTKLRAPAQPIEEAAATLPHYQLKLGQLGFNYVELLPLTADTTMIYYPGGDGQSFLMLDSRGRTPATDEWWIEPSPAITGMIDRHLDGLLPIGAPASSAGTSTAPWGVLIGAVLLAGLTLVLWEDRRRWLRRNGGSAAPKGT